MSCRPTWLSWPFGWNSQRKDRRKDRDLSTPFRPRESLRLLPCPETRGRSRGFRCLCRHWSCRGDSEAGERQTKQRGVTPPSWHTRPPFPLVGLEIRGWSQSFHCRRLLGDPCPGEQAPPHPITGGSSPPLPGSVHFLEFSRTYFLSSEQSFICHLRERGCVGLTPSWPNQKSSVTFKINVFVLSHMARYLSLFRLNNTPWHVYPTFSLSIHLWMDRKSFPCLSCCEWCCSRHGGAEISDSFFFLLSILLDMYPQVGLLDEIAKWNKPATEGQILHNSTYMRYLKWLKSLYLITLHCVIEIS